MIGGTGTFENNLNLTKSGGGTLVISADLSNWTGHPDRRGRHRLPGTSDLFDDHRQRRRAAPDVDGDDQHRHQLEYAAALFIDNQGANYG